MMLAMLLLFVAAIMLMALALTCVTLPAMETESGVKEVCMESTIRRSGERRSASAIISSTFVSQRR
jgi:hypothetical protein